MQSTEQDLAQFRATGGSARGVGPAPSQLDEIRHEMRTPLAIILGLCRELERAELDPDVAADVGRVRANAERLATRLDELFAPAAQSSPQTATGQPVDVGQVARAVCEDLRVIAALRRQRLVVEVSGGPVFAGREDDLHSLLANLIRNAIRSAPVGGLVRCSVATRGGRVKLEVADDGPGIPREERAQVLRPFVRGTGADSHDGGSGLGLAIVQRIVAEHQGRLTIATAPEGGALLAVELPASARPDATRRRPTPTYAFAV